MSINRGIRERAKGVESVVSLCKRVERKRELQWQQLQEQQ